MQVRFFFFFLIIHSFLILKKGVSQSLSDTVIVIPEVLISEKNIRTKHTATFVHTWSSDSLIKKNVNTIADLLSSETGVYVRNYGPGSLATSGIRGGSAGHTLVLWNGLPVQSPMLGLLDLTLLPVSAVESVEYVPGSDAAMWGSGAIGGMLNLNNSADFENNTKVAGRFMGGSFGFSIVEGQLRTGNHQWQSVSKYFGQQADNDFFYFLADGLPKRQQTNAAFRQHSFLQHFYWKISEKQRLGIHYWYQEADRQIPPTKVQTKSEAEQADISHRIMFDYKNFTKRGFWEMKGGFFSEKMDYTDSLSGEFSNNFFNSILFEMSRQWSWKNHHFLQTGFTNSYTKAEAGGYKSFIPEENRAALYVTWKTMIKKWTFQAGLRQEWIGLQQALFLPSFAGEYQVSKQWRLHSKINRNYRFPTLNDRFWRPGGNPDLLPESGWSGECATEYIKKFRDVKLDFQLTWYYRDIKNWILWGIRQGSFFFSADNIARVVSTGWEPRLSLIREKGKTGWTVTVGYDFVRSTNVEAVKNPKIEAGSQLIYTPLHQGFVNLQFEYKSLTLLYQHRYTGKTRGINEDISAFSVGNIRLNFTINKNEWSGNLFFHINNVWDKDYAIVERRPMPGIHFHGGLQCQFLRKQNNHKNTL